VCNSLSFSFFYNNIYILYGRAYKGDIIQAIFDNFAADTAKDELCHVMLSIGALYHNSQGYYLCGRYPIGNKCKGALENGEILWISVLSVEELLAIYVQELDNLKRCAPYALPQGVEYDVKVYPNDRVIESSTDKRGYPKSCGKENKNKRLIIIIKGDQN